MGFSPAGPYSAWMQAVETQRDANQGFELLDELGFLPGEVLMLGMSYLGEDFSESDLAYLENTEPLAKIGNRPGFLCRKPQARDGQWAGRSVCRMAVAVTAADEPETRGFMGPPGRL